MRIKIFVDNVLMHEEHVEGALLNSVQVKGESLINLITVNHSYPYPCAEKTYLCGTDTPITLMFSGSELFREAIEVMKTFRGMTVLDLLCGNVRITAENA